MKKCVLEKFVWQVSLILYFLPIALLTMYSRHKTCGEAQSNRERRNYWLWCWFLSQGLASYYKAETTFTFYFTILPLSRAFLSINNREMKSESGFSFAMASQPFEYLFQNCEHFHVNRHLLKHWTPTSKIQKKKTMVACRAASWFLAL